MVVVIVIGILAVTIGACFMLGFIPGTVPFQKKKLTDAIKSLECDDLLLTVNDFINKIFYNLGYLTKEEMDIIEEFFNKLWSRQIQRGGQDMKWVPNKYKSSLEKHTKARKKFVDMYVLKKDGGRIVNDGKLNFKNKCKEEVKTIFEKKIESCKTENKNNFKNKFVSLPTDIFDYDRLNEDLKKAIENKQNKLSPYRKIRKYLTENNKTIHEVSIPELEKVLPEHTKLDIQVYIEVMKTNEDFFKSLEQTGEKTSIPSEEQIEEEELNVGNKETFFAYGGNGKLNYAPL